MLRIGLNKYSIRHYVNLLEFYELDCVYRHYYIIAVHASGTNTSVAILLSHLDVFYAQYRLQTYNMYVLLYAGETRLLQLGLRKSGQG